MSKIQLPPPDEPIGTCPHCGASVRMKQSWRDKLSELVRIVNGLS